MARILFTRKRLPSPITGVVDAGRPAGSSSVVSTVVESGVSVHRLRQSALSAAICIAAAAAGRAARLGRSVDGRKWSLDGRSRRKGHHRWSWSTFVAGIDLSHVFHGGHQVLDANHDEHETDEQNNILDDPVDQWNDYESHFISIFQRFFELVGELIVKVMNACCRVKDDVERNEYQPWK